MTVFLVAAAIYALWVGGSEVYHAWLVRRLAELHKLIYLRDTGQLTAVQKERLAELAPLADRLA